MKRHDEQEVTSAPVRTTLERHAVRRAAAMPTVSVLVGPPGPAIRAWRAWAAVSPGRPVVTPAVQQASQLAAAVARSIRCDRDLHADACQFLAAHTGRSAQELQALLPELTQRDRDEFSAAVEDRLPPGVVSAVVRQIVEQGNQFDPGPDSLPGLAGLVPEPARPAVLLMPPANAADWFPRAGAAAVAIAEQVPALPIAVAVPAGVWNTFLTGTPESRVKAHLREGAVELPLLDEAAVARVLTEAGVSPPELPPAARQAAADGATAEFVQAFAAAAVAPTGAATPEESDRARSAAERALFELLEAIPETAGRFQLNADPGFRFRSRRAEVDLLAPVLRLAVEVDGFFHFREAENYRRDREKDYDLQRHGFLVLRFLADDIFVRLEEVRDRILEAVAAARPTTEGSTA